MEKKFIKLLLDIKFYKVLCVMNYKAEAEKLFKQIDFKILKFSDIDRKANIQKTENSTEASNTTKTLDLLE